MTFFLATGLPRSRTAWMARFLTYGRVTCLHEPSVGFRSMADLAGLLAQPHIGASDSAMALLWPRVARWVPKARFAVVRRPVEDVVASAARLGFADTAAMRETLAAIEAACDQLSARDGTLTLRYDELDTEEGCALLFRQCLGVDLPHEWWLRWRDEHVEADVGERWQEAAANIAGIRAVFGGRMVHA